MPSRRTHSSSTSGSSTAAALTVACTVHHATPSSPATSATARPESTTAASAAVRSRVVQRARVGSWLVVWVNVRRRQAGSAHTSLGLRTTTSTRPACGTSRTRCSTHACTRDDTTPQPGQPLSGSTGLHLHPAPAQRQIDRVDHPIAGQVEDHARSVTPRAHRLEQARGPS